MSFLRPFLIALGIAATLSVAPAASANMLDNGDAELGTGGLTNHDQVPPARWRVTHGFSIVRYGASSGFPNLALAATLVAGDDFFGGSASPYSSATQIVALERRQLQAARARRLRGSLSAQLGGYLAERDVGIIEVALLDRSRRVLARHRLGPVTAAERSGQTVMLARATRFGVPPNTRLAKVVMSVVRVDGHCADGYFDNVRLSLRGVGARPARS